jgi:hypothetical protein
VLVRGVVVWVGGEQGPAALLRADDGVCVGLGASELANGPCSSLV